MEEIIDKSKLWEGYNPSHESIKNIIKTQINNLFENQVTIGYYLKRVNDENMFKEDGFHGIGEYAYQTYGIDKDRCSWLIKIAERFCKDGAPCLKEEWRPFSISKLREMVYLTDDQLKEVSPDTTVKALREIKPKKDKVATSQLPERVQGEVVTQPVYCIDGGGTCSSYQNRNNCDSDNSNCPEFTDMDGHKNSLSDQECVNDVADSNETVNDMLDSENNTDSRKPPVGAVIYNVEGNGKISTYVVTSKRSSSSPNYFTVKDLSGAIFNLSINSEHWHCLKEDAKKDSWYREENKSLKVKPVIKEDNSATESSENVIETNNIVSNTEDASDQDALPRPDLPKLKNNDQRKEFIDNYSSWPVWIDQNLTGERYHRYDLTDKVAMVVKVNLKHAWENYKETKTLEYGAEQYYLIGVKSEYSVKGSSFKEDDTRTFYECGTNKSTLIEYLKEFQKGQVS